MTADTPSHSDLRKAAEAQPFERYPALASWIERLANGGHLSLGNWMTFIGSLNAAIVQAETRSSDEISALRGALEKAEQERDAAYGDLETLREWTRTHGGTHAENIVLKGRLRGVEQELAALKDQASG